jgi:hypothetical protein
VTVIVLDMSGSMGQNDPSGIRCSAANAYIDLSGPGSFVGAIGLDNSSGARGGAHNFETADWAINPQELATVNARQGLRTSIAQQSHNCRPDAATPTYDSLAKAEAMLASAAKGGSLSGSVILLTDGVPDPDTDAQIAAIRQDLLPQFKAHNWPIDTIALGKDQGDFHGFLSDVASATSGSYYDDAHGVIPGVSPLNITPFFLDIFKLRNGRSPGPDVGATQLDGGTTSRNFTVGDYVTHLDVVVVKDNRDTSVSIAAPDGQRITDSIAGTFVSHDPYYAIFAIDSPQQGPWQLDVSGGGLFLMNSLKTSSLALGISAPGDGAVQALGEPFTVTATLSNNGTPVSGGDFQIEGMLSYVGGDNTTPFAEDVVMGDNNGSSQYSATVTVPTSAPPGSYQLSIAAHAASEDVLTAQRIVRFALFPSAELIAPNTGKPTTDTVTAQSVRFDPVLQALYFLPPVSWISGWPLDGHPAIPSAVARGQVFLLDKPYAQASVTGTATRQGGKDTVNVTVANDGNGGFHLFFPAGVSGTYVVTLAASGDFAHTHGDLTHVQRTVLVTLVPSTQAQELHAWGITLVYLILLLLLVLVTRALLAPKPFGMLMSSEGGGEEFARARRGPIAWLLAPAAVTSRQMGMDPGLRFRFFRGHRITVKAAGGGDHYRLDGEPVPRHQVSAGEGRLTSADGAISYTVSTSQGEDFGDGEEEWGGASGGRRGLGGVLGRRRTSGDDYDDYDDDSRGGRRFSLPFGRNGRNGHADDLRADPWGDEERPAKGRSGSAGGGRRSGRSGRGKSDDWDDW